jgi:hypothetical protein
MTEGAQVPGAVPAMTPQILGTFACFGHGKAKEEVYSAKNPSVSDDFPSPSQCAKRIRPRAPDVLVGAFIDVKPAFLIEVALGA